MNLDPTPTPAQWADLDAARRDFPCYRIEVEPLPGRRRYIARRTQPGPGPHTLITSDLTELRAELGPTRPRATDSGQEDTHA
jgi:hypothetical protein